MKPMADKKRYTEPGAVRGVFVFALLASFALFSLLIVVLGVKEFRSIQQTAADNYISRTSLSYIAGKVRGGDGADSVSVLEHGGSDVLTLSGDYDGDIYNTYIYYMDGGICEYFGSDKRAFDPALGERIIDASGFACTLKDGLFTFTVTDAKGEAHSMSVYLQCGEVA